MLFSELAEFVKSALVGIGWWAGVWMLLILLPHQSKIVLGLSGFCLYFLFSFNSNSFGIRLCILNGVEYLNTAIIQICQWGVLYFIVNKINRRKIVDTRWYIIYWRTVASITVDKNRINSTFKRYWVSFKIEYKEVYSH